MIADLTESFWPVHVKFPPPEACTGVAMKASIAARTAIAAVAGGIGSVALGGKFADGAYSGAFFHLFNNEASVIASFEWHHMVPFTAGLDWGIPVDFINSKTNGWMLTKANHTALHSAGWIEAWQEYFRLAPDSTSVSAAYQHLGKLARDPRFREILSKGHMATTAYDIDSAKARMGKYIASRTGSSKFFSKAKFLPGALKVLSAGVTISVWKAEAADYGAMEATTRAAQRYGSIFGMTPTEHRQLEQDASKSFGNSSWFTNYPSD